MITVRFTQPADQLPFCVTACIPLDRITVRTLTGGAHQRPDCIKPCQDFPPGRQLPAFRQGWTRLIGAFESSACDLQWLGKDYSLLHVSAQQHHFGDVHRHSPPQVVRKRQARRH
jgi:hypothetical protein